MSATSIAIEGLTVAYPLKVRTGFNPFVDASEPGAFNTALHNVTFNVHEGERVGVIGPNGAGKSTLLRTISGILPPTRGNVTVTGRIAPLFEFATGFEMERTGLDNIRIRGLLQGMNWSEINERMAEIAAFSELGTALEQPVRTYSTGMFVRLAFSTATAIDPEVLVIDEAFGAGDQHFANKANRRMRELMDRGRILVFTSHNLALVSQLCNRTIWLSEGRVVEDGPSEAVLARYAATAD
ncbi:MAG: ABC transporter ATP-binding protein [Betaproteobacteria bacterium]